jgi:hypothetical protein
MAATGLCIITAMRVGMFLRRILFAAVCAALCATWSAPPAAAQFASPEIELDTRARVFTEAGAGITAMARDAAGRYYLLAGAEGVVHVFSADGAHQRRIALTGPGDQRDRGSALIFGNDLGVDEEGRLWVADRGGDAVRVFSADGRLEQSFAFPAPTSLVLLPDGEIALASMRTAQLVTVLDRRGRLVREFGEQAEAADRGELQRFLNIGRLAADREHHLYYSFAYLPEPTVRKYHPFGYLVQEIELTTLDVMPAAQAARREISRLERGGRVTLKATVDALGVDPEDGSVWLGIGGRLMRFAADGLRARVWRTYTPEGARVEPALIRIEPERILIAAGAAGIFEFPRPDKPRR